MTNDRDLVDLVDELDEIESKIDALATTPLRVCGRVVLYFVLVNGVGMGVVDGAYMLHWMAAALVIAGLPDAARYFRERKLTRRRDQLLQRRLVDRVGEAPS